MMTKEKARLEHLVFESGGYMSQASTKQFVAVLDFGAQYGQLIARRVRDLNVYSEIVPCDISADEVREMAPVCASSCPAVPPPSTPRTRRASTRPSSSWAFPCSASATVTRLRP